MSLTPEVIGRIILAKFLSLPLKRYENEINKIKTSELYQVLSPGIITFKKFSKASIYKDCNELNLNILGRIEQEGKTFSIRYRSSIFAGEYRFDRDELSKLIRSKNFANSRRDEIDLIERKLRLISTRNKITHMTLLGILEHQAAFLRSYDPLKIAPLSQVKISNWIKGQGYQWIDNSMVSRVVNDSLIIMPNGRHIKEILVNEEIQFKSNRLDRPYTDEEIRVRLKEVYGLNLLRRTVSYCRNQMGIAPFHRRAYNNQYPPGWVHFSSYFPMTLSSVKENVPEISGVYELSLVKYTIKYPLKPTGVFYIGSSKNIRKRLRTHLGCWSKNEVLNAFIYGDRCFLQVFCM